MDMNEKRIDVRAIEKTLRKKIVFNHFDELPDHHRLVLISDHNLLPLNKLFQKERPGLFHWQTVINGPDIWEIVIQKDEIRNLSINEILKWYPGAIHTFEAYGISYFIHGEDKLIDVYPAVEKLKLDLTNNNPRGIDPLRFDDWTISFTIDYIVHNHHTYVKKILPELETLLDHLVNAHASTHPQLPMVKRHYIEFESELIEHLQDEEKMVFPSMKSLELELQSTGHYDLEAFQDSINWMKEDHVLTGSSLKALRNYCDNYKAPPNSAPGFKLLYEELQKFELDMHFHIHLENNILFKKVQSALKTRSKYLA